MNQCFTVNRVFTHKRLGGGIIGDRRCNGDCGGDDVNETTENANSIS